MANLLDFDKIVLVGCDGVGKTTIAKKLESLGHKYVKCSHSDGDDKKALSLALLDKVKHCDKIVFDRFYFPDDIIYSNVVDNVDTNVDDWLEVYDIDSRSIYDRFARRRFRQYYTKVFE